MVTVFACKAKPRLGIPSKFSDEDLTKTKVPTLLLIGQDEVLYGSIDATVERARRLIPNSTYSDRNNTKCGTPTQCRSA
jgi:hypothetical protein